MNMRITSLPTTLLQVGAGALGLAAVGVLLIQGSEAAFTASTVNEGNVVTSGTVALSDSDGSGPNGTDTGTAMFNVGNLNGGQTITRCINVTYSGTLTADIKLFGTGTGELAPGLATTIEVGTGAAGGLDFSCAGFDQASATTLFPVPGKTPVRNTLGNFGEDHRNYEFGLQGHTGATATPATNATKSYKITMVVNNDNIYQSKTANASFTWEAQGRDVETGNKGSNGANTDDVNAP